MLVEHQQLCITLSWPSSACGAHYSLLYVVVAAVKMTQAVATSICAIPAMYSHIHTVYRHPFMHHCHCVRGHSCHHYYTCRWIWCITGGSNDHFNVSELVWHPIYRLEVLRKLDSQDIRDFRGSMSPLTERERCVSQVELSLSNCSESGSPMTNVLGWHPYYEACYQCVTTKMTIMPFLVPFFLCDLSSEFKVAYFRG